MWTSDAHLSIDLCFWPPDELLISSYNSNIGTNKVQTFAADDAVTARVIITCQNVTQIGHNKIWSCNKLPDNYIKLNLWLYKVCIICNCMTAWITKCFLTRFEKVAKMITSGAPIAISNNMFLCYVAICYIKRLYCTFSPVRLTFHHFDKLLHHLAVLDSAATCKNHWISNKVSSIDALFIVVSSNL